MRKIFGARAIVYIKYEGEITELARLLNEKLELPEIYFDTDTDPPHDVFGMTETLGFELWLNKTNSIEGFNYLIKIETDMDIKDNFDNEMFDLSPWFAKEISRKCKLETHLAITTE